MGPPPALLVLCGRVAVLTQTLATTASHAEEGFLRCGECAFENFRQAAFCGLCGADTERPDAKAERDGPQPLRAKASLAMQRLRSSVALRRKHSRSQLEIVSGLSSELIAEHDDALRSQQRLRASRRLRRARKRKEWTRKLDVEGKPFWYRDGCLSAADMSAQGSAVFFRQSEPDVEPRDSVNEKVEDPTPAVRIPEDEGAPAERTHEVEIVAVAEHETAEDGELSRQQSSPQPTNDTLGKQSEMLEHLVTGSRVEFVDAGDAVASELPVTAGDSTVASIKDVLTMAAKDFPTKYAHFVTTAASLMVPPTKEHLRLNIERESLFEDSLESLAVIPLKNVRSTLRINFLDEHGVDAGGVHREWFIMLTEMLADPSRGLFVCVDKSEQTFHLNPNSKRDVGEKHLLFYYAIGRVIGRALLEGSVMALHLSSPLLKLMLGLPLSFADLEDFDQEVYRSMQWLLENDNVEELGLDFTVTTEEGDVRQVVELIPNGGAVTVTDANKNRFVDLKWKFLLVERVSCQLQALLKGFYEVVPSDLIMLLDASELDFLLCGSDEIDVDDWEKNTKYTEELHEHRARIWFWEFVREMPNEYRRRLLLFSTGSSRVPLAGFGALTSYDGKLCPFTLKGVALVGDGFLHSHACFNRIDLPLHVVRSELRAVMYAILETEQYGFTTD